MRAFLVLAVSLLGTALAGAAEINMRDPLEYPNMLSAPLGKHAWRRSQLSRQHLAKRDRSRASAVSVARLLAHTPLLTRCKPMLLSAGYNPMQSGAMRQGRVPKRYIVRMKRHKDMDGAILK